MSSISGIGSSQSMMGMMGMMGNRSTSELTEEQKEKVKSILANYSSSSITAADAKEIFEQFEEAGITPMKGLKEAIEEAGFDAENLRTLGMPDMQGGPAQMGGMGKPPQMELTEDQISTVASILDEYDSENLTTSDAQAIFQAFADAGITPGKGLKEAIEAAGFDAEELRSLAMPSNEPTQEEFWAAQNTLQNIDTSALQSLQSILNQYDLSNLTTDQENSLYAQLLNTGLFSTGSYYSASA